MVDLSAEQWERQLAVNLRGVFLFSKYSIPEMRRRGGSIINISSVHALVSWPRCAAYDATKSALIGLTRAMAVDHGNDGIRVNAICPGYIETPLLEQWFATGAASKEEVLKFHPLGRIGKPNDVASLTLSPDLLPATLGAFRKAYPRTALNLFDMTPAEQYRARDERQIDLGFVCFRVGSTHEELQWACVGHDNVMVAVAAGNPLAKQAKIDLMDLEPMFFVGMSAKTYPGSNEWLTNACHEAGFTPRILQDAEGEPAVIGFVAAGLGVALLPEQIKKLPHQDVIFRPLRRQLAVDSRAVWNANNSSDCLKQYIQIVKQPS